MLWRAEPISKGSSFGKNRRVINMKYPKLRELKEAIRAIIKGPYTHRFPYREHVPAPRFRGKPEFHEQDCMGCTACCQVCPSGALSYRDEGNTRTLIYRVSLCIFCGQCEANCPTTKGIILSRQFDLATTDYVETLKQEIQKELYICECCGEAIVPLDQIKWVAKKIGPLSFTNTSLILFYMQGLELALKEKAASNSGGDEYARYDRIKILCPKCRREAVVKS